MKKMLLMAVLLLTAAVAQAEDWKLVYQDDEQSFYVRTDNYDAARNRVWVKNTFDTPACRAQKMKNYDCKDTPCFSLQQFQFDKNFGNYAVRYYAFFAQDGAELFAVNFTDDEVNYMMVTDQSLPAIIAQVAEALDQR